MGFGEAPKFLCPLEEEKTTTTTKTPVLLRRSFVAGRRTPIFLTSGVFWELKAESNRDRVRVGEEGGGEAASEGLERRCWDFCDPEKGREVRVVMGGGGGAERLAWFAPPQAGQSMQSVGTRGTYNPGSGSSAGSEPNDHSHHASPRRGRLPRGRAAPYLRPRGWGCQRWCAPPACAWKSPGSGPDREPGPKPWPAAEDGDRRRTRRQPTAWSLLLDAPSAAGLSCSSWTKERAALRVLGCCPAEAPWPPQPPAPLPAPGAEFPRGGRRGQSQEHNPRGVLEPSRPPAPCEGSSERIQRPKVSGSMERHGDVGRREWFGASLGSRLPSSKAKQEWAKTPFSPPSLPLVPLQ